MCYSWVGIYVSAVRCFEITKAVPDIRKTINHLYVSPGARRKKYVHTIVVFSLNPFERSYYTLKFVKGTCCMQYTSSALENGILHIFKDISKSLVCKDIFMKINSEKKTYIHRVYDGIHKKEMERDAYTHNWIMYYGTSRVPYECVFRKG